MHSCLQICDMQIMITSLSCTPQDDVERALAREIAHLHAVTAQINHKASSIDKELENLEIAAATITDNIRWDSFCMLNASKQFAAAPNTHCTVCHPIPAAHCNP